MKTISLDLRERIVAAYDGEEGTREEVAKRFRVSVGMVKKLLQQRRKTGELGDRHRYSGRKAKILPEYRERLGALIAAQPDLTLVFDLPVEVGLERAFGRGLFETRFESKGRFQSNLAGIPRWIIDPTATPALHGAARALDIAGTE